MPNRILKDTICASPELDVVSDGAEVLFYRLIVIADDFGRFDGRPTVVDSRCFSLRRRGRRVWYWLAELVEVGLIDLYDVDGREYGRLAKWDKHQRRRATASKFPPPNDGRPLTSADIRAQVTADDRRGHPRADDGDSRTSAGSIRKRSTKSGSDSGSKSKTDSGSRPGSVSNHGKGRPGSNGRVQAHEPETQTEERRMSDEARELAERTAANAKRLKAVP
jgi:hypothetical protein